MPEEILESSLVAVDTYGAAIHSTVPASTAAAVATLESAQATVVNNTANATATVVGSHAGVFTSTAAVGATLSGGVRTSEVLTSAAAAEPTLDGRRTLPLSSTAAAAATLQAAHAANVADAVAAAATLLGENTANASLSSAAVVYDSLAASSVMILASAAAAADSFGAVGITTAKSSTAAAAETVVSTNYATSALTSAAAVASTLATQLHAVQVMISSAVVRSRVTFAATMRGYWTNTTTTAAATWDHLTVNSIVEKDGVLYGASATGVHELTETGTHEGRVLWDLADFGNPQLKTVDSVYIDATAGGALRVNAATKDGSWSYRTHLAAATTKTQNHRATLGRGLKATHYRFAISASHVFDIGGVVLQIADAERRR